MKCANPQPISFGMEPSLRGRWWRIALVAGIALVALAGCSSPTGAPTNPADEGSAGDSGEILTEVPYLTVVLVRDAEHAAEGNVAREEMLVSTMLYQRELAEHLGIFFDVREHAVSIDLNPETETTGETKITDYLHKFRTWKASALDDATNDYQPHASLYTTREFVGALGLAYVGAIGTGLSVSIMTTEGSSANTRAWLAARYTGYNLGGSANSHSESGFILSTQPSATIPSEYHPAGLQDMRDRIAVAEQNRGTLPTVPIRTVDVGVSASWTTLTWQFGDASSSTVVYRSATPVPLSCFDCEEFPVSALKQLTDTSVTSGTTYHYRVVERGPGGDLRSVSDDLVVDVP